MDAVEKMDCTVNDEVFFGATRTLGFDSMQYPSRWGAQGLFQEKEMGYAIKLSMPRTTDRWYPMLPATITKIHQAFEEIKHMNRKLESATPLFRS